MQTQKAFRFTSHETGMDLNTSDRSNRTLAHVESGAMIAAQWRCGREGGKEHDLVASNSAKEHWQLQNHFWYAITLVVLA